MIHTLAQMMTKRGLMMKNLMRKVSKRRLSAK
jgi:hypothetical protein